MLKKLLIVAVAVAIGVSPLLPRVFADSGEFETTIAEAAWDYDYYRVQRLSVDDVDGPYAFADVVFTSEPSGLCEYEESCKQVDLTIFADGEQLEIFGANEDVTSPFWFTGQDERFVFYIPSETDESWGVVYEFDSQTNSLIELIDMEVQENELAFMTFAIEGDRVFTSTLHEDEDTGDIETTLSMYDFDSGYERDDFTYTLTAPWQEIVDIYDGVALVRFQFEGGYEQLWIVNQTERWMESIPDTWTEPEAEIVAPYFRSDGTIQYFRNYRLFTYDWQAYDAYEDGTGMMGEPQEYGGAYLTWFEDAEDAVQVVGDRLAYIDDENGLYVSDLDGVSKFGVALDGAFTLEETAIYFQNSDGEYVGYTFDTGVWQTRAYHVTDSFEDVLVGIDANGDVWYENLTNGYLMNVGFGAKPSLTDREHAYWLGTDGNLYEVTFSPLLDLERPDVEAFQSYTDEAVFLISGESIWTIPNETTFYTWFDSWDDVVLVSQATMDVYVEIYNHEGELKFAPGTRVKAASSAKVYVVGSDYELHWIVSETVADEVYGSDWNIGIIEVNDTYLWQYATGDDVADADDVRTI